MRCTIHSIKFFALFLLILSMSISVRADDPPCISGGCGTTIDSEFTFGEAKAHSHNSTVSNITGYYCGRDLINDPTNNGGNLFRGNMICVTDMNGTHWFYFDWSADPHASEKIAVWTSNYPWQWVSVNFDADCKLAFSAFNPWTSDGI